MEAVYRKQTNVSSSIRYCVWFLITTGHAQNAFLAMHEVVTQQICNIADNDEEKDTKTSIHVYSTDRNRIKH